MHPVKILFVNIYIIKKNINGINTFIKKEALSQIKALPYYIFYRVYLNI
jgi:hypothetical protein